MAGVLSPKQLRKDWREVTPEQRLEDSSKKLSSWYCHSDDTEIRLAIAWMISLLYWTARTLAVAEEFQVHVGANGLTLYS